MEEQGRNYYNRLAHCALLPPETDKYAELIELLSKIPHGRVTIFIQDGKPVRIEEAIRSTKL